MSRDDELETLGAVVLAALLAIAILICAPFWWAAIIWSN